MIDLTREQIITLPEAIALLRDRPSVATLWRWRTRGVRGRRLESITLGARVYTSIEALQRFAEQHGGIDAPAIRSPTKRERDIRRAESELSEAGVISANRRKRRGLANLPQPRAQGANP